mmetsp:Transcript_4079/g.4463  ORF Transcript_4079/g.4463 Transcript_4079/m.4463 type:complete len:255 (+) Transcript_4079:2-766(+)
MSALKLSGKEVASNVERESVPRKIFFWLRCLVSLAVLSYCASVTFVALFNGQTTMWNGVPPGVSLILFVLLLAVVGMLESMQIAFFAVAKLPPSERGNSYFATKTCDLLFQGDGKNLPAFMIGRQLSIVSCMFFVARVTSVSLDENDENIFGVPNVVQALFNTGLLGALLLTIVGSIAWQLVASAFPRAILANPLTYVLLRICLLFESTGICSGAWVLAEIHKRLAGFQRDEVYIGTAEERSKKFIASKSLHLT